METWLEFFGRLHPVLVHVPIGSLVTLAVLELWNKARRRPAPTEARRLVAFVTAATAVGAAGAGWLLSSEGYGGDTLLWHRAFGIAFAVGATALWITSLLDRARAWRVLFWITCLLAVTAGHQGAEMTHGEGWLFEPFRSEEPEPPDSVDTESGETESVDPEAVEPATAARPMPTQLRASEPEPAPMAASAVSPYERDVAPVLKSHCYACHGPSKQKSGFAMHEPELLLRGGYGGESIVPGDSASSELVRRLRLPLEDEEHMPPPEKPQPSEEQVAAIAAWIDAGAEVPASESGG